MVVFHLCYDLKYLMGHDLPWFAPPLQDIWRASISWTFLFVAGCMCAYSHSNLHRAFRYLGVATAIYVVTSIVAVDAPISFGIIYCMGICTLCVAMLERHRIVPSGCGIAAIFFALFVISLPASRGYLGIGPLHIALPRQLFETTWLSWLGFPGPGFVSSDYYPPIPYLFMYLVGVSTGFHWRGKGVPRCLATLRVMPLEQVGQHALGVYVLHQPALLMLAYALTM